MPEEEVAADLSSGAEVLGEGEEVILSGLKARPQLNGLKATFLKVHNARMAVRLMETGECIRIKPENLTRSETIDAIAAQSTAATFEPASPEPGSPDSPSSPDEAKLLSPTAIAELELEATTTVPEPVMEPATVLAEPVVELPAEDAMPEPTTTAEEDEEEEEEVEPPAPALVAEEDPALVVQPPKPLMPFARLVTTTMDLTLELFMSWLTAVAVVWGVALGFVETRLAAFTQQ